MSLPKTSRSGTGIATAELDVTRLVETLDRHGVEYLIVGGVAAGAYGAVRPTVDFDCVVRRATQNLDRLAAVLLELHAYLRVHGMSDEEASALPVRIDSVTLLRSELSTWRTDAGDVDVLADIPDRQGRRRSYEDLVVRAYHRIWPLDEQSVPYQVRVPVGRAVMRNLKNFDAYRSTLQIAFGEIGWS